MKTETTTQEKRAAYNKAWREKNKDYFKEYHRVYHQENKNDDHYKAKRAEAFKKHFQKRRDNDPVFREVMNVRNLIKQTFKFKYRETSKICLILGCDYYTWMSHIENQFDENMNWSNHGSYWEIDHKSPISQSKSIKDIYELSHYTNLRPLEKSENRRYTKI